MRVWFTCQGCSAKNAPVDVPDREQGEDLGSWMEKLQRAVGAAHQEFSPGCRTRKCDLRIPVPEGTTQVGRLPHPGEER